MPNVRVSRKDTFPGFEDRLLAVEINGYPECMSNGESTSIKTKRPVQAVVLLAGKKVWSGEIKPTPNGKFSLHIGVTEDYARMAGLIENKICDDVVDQDNIKAAESPAAQRAMKKAEYWRLFNKLRTFSFFGAAIILGVLGQAEIHKDKGAAILYIAAAVFSGIFAVYYGNLRPASCPKCSSTAARRYNRVQKLIGVRSVQKIVQNHVTKQEEQRTVTVSDVDVTEFWDCLSCQHKWTKSYADVVK